MENRSRRPTIGPTQRWLRKAGNEGQQVQGTHTLAAAALLRPGCPLVKKRLPLFSAEARAVWATSTSHLDACYRKAPLLEIPIRKRHFETDSYQDSWCSKWGMWDRFSLTTRALSGCPGEGYIQPAEQCEVC